jgi:hypothetical protein
VFVRIPAQLTPTTAERVSLPSGREEALPKATPRFPKWNGDFPWSTYGGKPILALHGEPADFLRCQYIAPGAIRTQPVADDHPIRVDVGVLAQRHRVTLAQTSYL